METIGNILGSQVGALLGGDSLAGKIAMGTVVGTFAQNVGELFQKGFDITRSILDGQAGSAKPLQDALAVTFSDFGTDFALNLRGQAFGQLSSLLIAELADALNLKGFEGGIFTSIGTTITNQILSNAWNVATGAQAASMFNGFNPAELIGNFNAASFIDSLGGTVAGYLGSYFGSQAVLPDNQEASIGTSLGSSVGAYLGSLIPVPLLGNFIGAFLGSVLGTKIGNAVGTDEKAALTVYLDPVTKTMVYGSPYQDNGGHWTDFKGIAESEVNTINRIVDMIGGKIVSAGSVGFMREGTTFTTMLADGFTYDYVSSMTSPPRGSGRPRAS